VTAIYKICTATEWRAAERAGIYQGSAVDQRDGFCASTRSRSIAPDVTFSPVRPGKLRQINPLLTTHAAKFAHQQARGISPAPAGQYSPISLQRQGNCAIQCPT